MSAGPDATVWAQSVNATTASGEATATSSGTASGTTGSGTAQSTDGSVSGAGLPDGAVGSSQDSTDSSVYTPAPAQLHDFAPLSSITLSRTGPADVTYTKAESKHLAPLVGGDAWRGFCQQSGRNIIIKLPVTVAVYSVSVQMEQIPHIGVHYPDHVDFEVNQNGTWYEADKVPSPIATWNNQNTKETITGHLDNVATDEVMIHFPVAGWVFARQIHVWGTNASQAQEQVTMPLPQAPLEVGKAMTTSDLNDYGIKNMLLVYNDGTTPQGTWTVKDFLPMVGYRSRQGNIEDRMFDTMLFLPTGKLANTQASWYGFLSNLFSPGTQLSALNEAVGQVNDALAAKSPDAENFKEKVVVALPYPLAGSGRWGMVGGHVVNFNGGWRDPGGVQARTTALDWYLQTLENAWAGAGYTHLELTGVYWLSEKVNFQNPDDPALIQQVSALTSSMNLPLFWIPYYDAAGIDNWQTEGFTAAWLQSHYLAGKRPDMHRLGNAIQLARDTGMGFEVEASWKMVGNARYEGYYANMLNVLEKNGMAGDISHAYYAGSKVYVTSAYSQSASGYAVYQKTYEFIRHS